MRFHLNAKLQQQWLQRRCRLNSDIMHVQEVLAGSSVLETIST